MENVNNKIENGVLVIALSGKIDTANASEVEAAINEAKNAFLGDEILINCENLKYVSSAGLRVILRLRKAYPKLRLTDVHTDIYEILEMTGFTEMMTVEKAYRKLSVDGCPIIGHGAKGIVYRWNEDTIVKVYRDKNSLLLIQRERELAKSAFVAGIPTAIPYDVVKVGDRFGSVFELLNARSYSDMICEHPENLETYVTSYAKLLRQIHATPADSRTLPDIKVLIRDWLETSKSELSDSTSEKLKALVEAVPDSDTMLHSDYHTNNLMMQGDETLLIDMDTLSHGHPIFELGNIYATYVSFGEKDPAVVERFLGFSYETAKKVWQIFLPAYLETDDPARLADVEKKAQLVGYLRYLRHTIRRDDGGVAARETISLCAAKIDELLGKVDRLDF